MLNLYKKIEKSEENKQGVILLSECPFDKPCLLAVSAQDTPKSVFGIVKTTMRMARLRTRNNKGAKYDLSSFPVSFLGIRNEIDLNPNEKEFVDRYFSKILTGSKEEVKSNLRNINILAYCDGLVRVKKILNEIEKKLIENGFSNVDEMMSQIALITLSTEKSLNDVKATVIDFHDINDPEVGFNPDNITLDMVEEAKERKEKLTIKSSLKSCYLFDGSGFHNLKQYFGDCVSLSPCLSKVLSNILTSSIDRKEINSSVVCDGVEELIELGKNNSSEELMSMVDSKIKYSGASKLSDKECELFDRLDEAYDKFMKLEREKSTLEEEKTKLVSRKEKMLETAYESCTPGTYYRILLSSGYQLPLDKLDIINQTITDKEQLEYLMNKEENEEKVM